MYFDVFQTAPSGGWSSWTDWGPCDKGCTMIRERFCASTNREDCPGVDPDGIQTDKKHCDSEECNGEKRMKQSVIF